MRLTRRDRTVIPLVMLVLVAGAVVGAAAPPAPRATRTIVVEGTLAATMSPPRVHVQLRRGERILTAEPGLLDGFERVRSFPAYLDTGSSGHVLSRSTAGRFGVEADGESVYHEVGLHGETTVGVSVPLSFGLAGWDGDAAPPDRLPVVQEEVAFELTRATPGGLAALLGAVDVIGMPAIRTLVVEIEPPAPAAGRGAVRLEDLAAAAGPAVRLHPGRVKRRADVEIALEYIDYNQTHHPGNRGRRPELAANPVVTGVETGHEGRSFTGDWLLDTGAAASIISVKHAQTLGLYDADGRPAREPDFTLPLGGIGGTVEETPGFVVDTLRIGGLRKRSIEFRRAHVVVKDVGVTDRRGRRVVLDGVLGLNLMLDSVGGFAGGMPTTRAPARFARIWIDGPRRRLALERR
jgi:hypothetical protein